MVLKQSMSEKISVTFHVTDGGTYQGEFGPLQIVHEAMGKLLPAEVMYKQRVIIRKGEDADDSDLIYPDMFLGEIHHHYGDCELFVTATPLSEAQREWTQVGFDHLALSVQDRQRARDFFHIGLKMDILRDDEHIVVVTTGNTSLFFFSAEPGQPLSDGVPSRIHHIGFVVDDLEAAFGHLQAHFPDFASDFTLLERMERWSLYGRYTIGDITFMIQLSQIKDAYRGFPDPNEYADIMYNYRSRPYGVRFERPS
jgi:hypothetical protein